MPRVRLTDRAIPGLPPHATRNSVEYFDEQCQGLALRVTRKGSRSWNVIYRHKGRQRRFTLGRYPVIGLKDARVLAREVMLDVARGDDPASQKQAWRHQMTINELANQFVEQHVSTLRSSREYTRIIEQEIKPRWGTRPLDDLSRRDLINTLDEIAGRAPYVANRTLAVLRKMFNWAIYRELANTNPCQYIKPPGKEQKRDRVLSPDEIVRIWNACDELSDHMSVAFRLRILTAQRGGEVRAMRWEDIEGEWWTIPASRAKNGKSHRVPLGSLALEEIAKLKRTSEWVFPSSTDDRKHMDNDQKAAAKLKELSGVENFRPHDFRRTAASMMASEGVPRIVIQKILNHTDTSVTAIYERYSYDNDKRDALARWESLVDQWIKIFNPMTNK